MSSKDILKLMKDKQVEFVDLRFTDPKGKLQHLTMDSTVVDEDMLNKGVFFDGSSIAGWKAINESDMILKPDLDRPIIDPFNSLSFKVSNDFVSIAINNGCLKAPIKFLPCLKFTPVFPPIEASTIAAKLVGKCITFNPLNHEDATNPTRSVVTPPPIEINMLFLSDPALKSQS